MDSSSEVAFFAVFRRRGNSIITSVAKAASNPLPAKPCGQAGWPQQGHGPIPIQPNKPTHQRQNRTKMRQSFFIAPAMI